MDELNEAIDEARPVLAAFSRAAEQWYHQTNGDYTLIATTNELSRLYQRLSRMAWDAHCRETANADM